MSSRMENPFLEDDDEGLEAAPAAKNGWPSSPAPLPSISEAPSPSSGGISNWLLEEDDEEASMVAALHGEAPGLPPRAEEEEEEAPSFALPDIPEETLPSGVPQRHVGILAREEGEEEGYLDDDDDDPFAPFEEEERPASAYDDPFAEDEEDLHEEEELDPFDPHDPSSARGDDGELSADDLYYSYYDPPEEDLFDGFSIDTIIGDAIDKGASDIHIFPHRRMAFRILGDQVFQEQFGIPTGQTLLRVQQAIISHVLEADFVEKLELDTSYVVKTGPHTGRRMRLSVGKTFGEIYMVMRVIADQVPSPQDLGIEDSLLNWVKLPKGLIMVNGPTGTGKSTTIASMLREIQLTRPQNIITLERPVEFIYPDDGKATIVQREIGKDARTFANALTSAMRQDPDIILVGEVRDRLEVNELLRAAETGHLAISTMHTRSPAATITRIMGLFEGDDQRRILTSLSDVTRGFANQLLLKTADGKRRVAVREILTVDEEVADLIAQGDVKGIHAYQMRREATIEHELVRVVKRGEVRLEEAQTQTDNPLLLERLMESWTPS